MQQTKMHVTIIFWIIVHKTFFLSATKLGQASMEPAEKNENKICRHHSINLSTFHIVIET